MDIFENYESNVRSYCRSFPAVFDRAKDSFIYSESGKKYIDFFSGAGTLNYGHNNDHIKRAVLKYLESDSVLHSLDMFTAAKRSFINEFVERILQPRNLDYKLQFCAPTGANAVEAALKIARVAKNRSNVFAFKGGFHGMSLGALSVTANSDYRKMAGVPLTNVTFIDYYTGAEANDRSGEAIENTLSDSHSGIEKPAAIIFETIQAEGGINVASIKWLQELSSLCKRNDILFICDDIQVGCYRTGSFFSFERAGIIPDIVLLSKSISGIGLPMSLLLMKRELDIWRPGEHSGTFRGNQLAFVGAVAALEYADEIDIISKVKEREVYLKSFLQNQIGSLSDKIQVRGLGMIWGIDVSSLGNHELSKKIAMSCFDRGLIIERCGREDTVLKVLPPLNIQLDALDQGCNILKAAINDCV